MHSEQQGQAGSVHHRQSLESGERLQACVVAGGQFEHKM